MRWALSTSCRFWILDFRVLIKPVLFLALILGYISGVAQAHGGGVPRLTNAEVGPYWVSVWTQPDPLRAGEVHFTVAVSEPGLNGREVGAPILDATLELWLIPLNDKQQQMNVWATHDEAVNKLFYEADIEVPW